MSDSDAELAISAIEAHTRRIDALRDNALRLEGIIDRIDWRVRAMVPDKQDERRAKAYARGRDPYYRAKQQAVSLLVTAIVMLACCGIFEVLHRLLWGSW